jgi:hypothetical protein
MAMCKEQISVAQLGLVHRMYYRGNQLVDASILVLSKIGN